MTPSAYTALKERAMDLIAEGFTDEGKEAAIQALAAKALAYAGKDSRLARLAIRDHAFLVSKRSKAAVERLERERGLR